MKKYIVVFLLVATLFGFGAKAQAVTFDDLLQEISNLKQQIVSLRAELGAAVSRAITAPVVEPKSSVDLSSVKVTEYPSVPSVRNSTVVEQAPVVVPETKTESVPAVSVRSNTPNVQSPMSMPSAAEKVVVMFSHNLVFGERGEEVKKLQDLLVSMGYLTADNATGFYGKVTVAAVKAFQAANGINDDGMVVGPKTQAALKAVPQGGATPMGASPLPVGCTSTQGYSPVTGQPCNQPGPGVGATGGLNGTTLNGYCAPLQAPTIKVLSPNGGEIYQAGQQITITWESCNIPSTANVYLYLGNGQLAYPLKLSTPNDGSETVTLPTQGVFPQMTYGNVNIVEIGLVAGGAGDNSNNFFTITSGSPACGLGAPAILSASSTASQYIAAGNTGAADATRITLNFSSIPGGAASTITELKFSVSGPGSVTSVRVNNVSVPVVAGVAWLQGLNIPVPANGGPGVLVDAYISYAPVSISGTTPDTDSTVSLTFAKYICGSTVATMTPFLQAPTMTMVGSKPIVSMLNASANNLMLGAENLIGEIVVSADAHGNIKINDIGLTYAGTNINNFALSNVRITDSLNGPTISNSACTFTNVTVTCEFGSSSNSDYDGYVIAAGTTKVFDVKAVINGTSSGLTSSVFTSFPISGFNWDDTSTNGASGKNLSAYLIYNFPTGSFSVHN